MRKINSFKNMVADLSYILVSMVLRFFLIRIIVKNLGTEYGGLDSFFSQVIGYLNLADLGFSTAALYKLYDPIREKNGKRIDSIYDSLSKIYRYLTLVILFCGTVFSFFIDFFIKNSYTIGTVKIKVFFIIYLLSVLIPNLYIGKLTIINSTQKIYKLNKWIYPLEIIKITLQILFILNFKSYILSLGSILFINLLIMACVEIYFKKNHNNKKLKDKDVLKELIIDSKDVFAHKFSSVIVDGTDYITLTYFTSLTSVNLFANYNMMFIAVKGIIGKIFKATIPSVGDLIAENNVIKIRSVFYKMFIFGNYLSFVSIFCFINFTEDFIKIWLGKNFVLSKSTLILFILNFYINLIMGIFVIFKSAKGLYKDDIRYVYVQAITNLILSIYLAPKLGINGVLIGTLIGNILGLIYPKIKIVTKKILLESPKTLMIYFFKLFLIFIVFTILNKYILATILKYFINISTIYSLFISLFIYLFISSLILVLLFLFFLDVRIFVMLLLKKIINVMKTK